MTDYAENPTPRILAAESRRRMRALIEDSSLGTAGAQALRKRAAGEALTPDEEIVAAAEMASLEWEMRRGR